jgi:ankyrin repeat protein
VAELLREGVAVDSPDDAGETALMKSIQARHPTVAALLRRHGADLDLKNHAGVSARALAASSEDPELLEALGLAR